MVNGEAGSTEFVSRMDKGNSKKKRKRVKGDNLVDSSSLIGLSEVEHGVGSLNRIEVGNFDSPNERRKKKKKKREKHGNDQEVMDHELGEVMNENSESQKEEKKKKKKKKEKEKKKQQVEEKKQEKTKEEEREEEKKKKKKEEEGEEEKKKKKKKDKKKKQLIVQEPVLLENSVGDDEATTKELENTEYSIDRTKDKKRKTKTQTNDVGKRVEINSAATDALDSSPPKSTPDRVSSAEDEEVLPNSDDSNDETASKDKELVRGKRFSPEEDKLVQAACWDYVNSKGLGDEEGIQMIMNCRKHKKLRNCWMEICAAIPWRPHESVRYRAHILFERDSTRKWTEEDRELVMKYHEKCGTNWKPLADAMGKHRHHVKDAFRRMKLKNLNSGRWSQDEYQAFYELVNTDLRMKAFGERKSKHGMLRDNISWTAISDKLDTRTFASCCEKWYKQLASPMVAQQQWLDTDDYLLVNELYTLDACCMEDVDWDCLLEHRTGDVCRKRWNEMVKHLGEGRNKSFSEQVEILAKRYTPDVLEAREAYYSKPVVD